MAFVLKQMGVVKYFTVMWLVLFISPVQAKRITPLSFITGLTIPKARRSRVLSTGGKTVYRLFRSGGGSEILDGGEDTAS